MRFKPMYVKTFLTQNMYCKRKWINSAYRCKSVLIPNSYQHASWFGLLLLIDAQVGVDFINLSTRKLACIPSVYQHPGQYWLHLLFWCTSWCLFCLLIDAQVGVVSVSLWMCKLVWNPSAYRRAGLCWFCPLIDPQVGVDSVFLLTSKLVLCLSS